MGTVLLLVGFLGVLASGLASIPVINGETDDRNRAAQALVDYVQLHAPGEIRNSDAAPLRRPASATATSAPASRSTTAIAGTACSST